MVLDAKASIGSANEMTNLLFTDENGGSPITTTLRAFSDERPAEFSIQLNKQSPTCSMSQNDQKWLFQIAIDPLGFRLQLAYLLKNGRSLPESITMVDGTI